MSSVRIPEWASSALMLVIAAGAGFLIWSLAAENRQLNAEITDLYAERNSLQETTALQISFAEGDTIPDTPVVGPAGETATLSDLVSGGGVVAFLTTTCPFCQEMLPVWAELSREYSARGVSFAAVMLDTAGATKQYVAEHSVEFPLWALLEPATAEVKVAIVPYTLLVGPGGVVRNTWPGLLDTAETAMLAAALDDELFAAQQMLSGSSADPDCCEATALGADATGGQ